MVGYFAIISSAKLHKSRETGLELNLRGGSRSGLKRRLLSVGNNDMHLSRILITDVYVTG